MKKMKRLNIISLCLIFTMSVFAADNDLITKQITVCVDKPGCLANMIGESKKYCITYLKLTGQINGDDIQFLREMAGCEGSDGNDDGKLACIDMSEAMVVSGGMYYYFDEKSKHMTGVYSWNNIVSEYMFYGCKSLERVTLPQTATEIKKCAFAGCKRLTEVKMGNNLKTIGERVFSDCSSLKNIKIHGNVETIGNGAFEGCTSLLSVYSDCKKTPLLGKGVFAGCNRKCCVLIVPQGTYCSYWLSSWGDFFINIKEQNNMNK